VVGSQCLSGQAGGRLFTEAVVAPQARNWQNRLVGVGHFLHLDTDRIMLLVCGSKKSQFADVGFSSVASGSNRSFVYPSPPLIPYKGPGLYRASQTPLLGRCITNRTVAESVTYALARSAYFKSFELAYRILEGLGRSASLLTNCLGVRCQSLYQRTMVSCPHRRYGS